MRFQIKTLGYDGNWRTLSRIYEHRMLAEFAAIEYTAEYAPIPFIVVPVE